MERWSRVVRRNDSSSDDSPTSYVRAGDVPARAPDDGEQPTSNARVDEFPTSIVRQDEIPTSVMTSVTPSTSPPPPAKTRSSFAIVATWTGFAVVAVAVVAGTTAWASSLRGPGDGGQADAPSLANVRTVEQATPPPTPVAPPPTTETASPEPTSPPGTRGSARAVVPVPTTSAVPLPSPPPGAAPAPVDPVAPVPTTVATPVPTPTSAAGRGQGLFPRSDEPETCQPGAPGCPPAAEGPAAGSDPAGAVGR